MIVSSRRSVRLNLIPNNVALARLFMLLAAALAMRLTASDSNYCAFEVKVSEPSGTPVTGVPVVTFRRDGSVFSETTTATTGIAKLCDAPLEGVDIVAGFDMCESVVVRNIKATWPETRRVFFTYVKTFCPHFTFEDHCKVLLRIQDEDGRPLAGARFQRTPPVGSKSDVSDIFGRLFQSLRSDEKLEGIVVKEGREPGRVSVKCLHHDEHDIEQKVILHKQ